MVYTCILLNDEYYAVLFVHSHAVRFSQLVYHCYDHIQEITISLLNYCVFLYSVFEGMEITEF